MDRGAVRLPSRYKEIVAGPDDLGAPGPMQLHQAGPQVGKYTVNLTDLDGIGAHSITSALSQSDPQILIIDEIGPMELKSKRFIEAVENALDSNKPLIVTVHQRSVHELVRRIKRTFEILEVTEANRDEMAAVIMKTVKNRLNGEG